MPIESYLQITILITGSMQEKPILYTYFRSSTAHRVRIALNLKKIDYEARFINLRDGEEWDPKYKEINPNQAVPALQLPDNTILIESVAILEYLEELYPEPRLLPNDPVRKAQIRYRNFLRRGFCEVINSAIHPYQNLRLMEMIEVVAPKFDRQVFTHSMLVHNFGTLEALLNKEKEKGKFCFGNEVTLADLFLVPQVNGAVNRFKVNLDEFPRVKEVYNNLKDIPEFFKAQPDQQPDFV